jgi:hypothetical protein
MVIAGLTAGALGAIIAGPISVLVGRYTPVRGAVLGLNAAGANLGLFAGLRLAARRWPGPAIQA